MKFFRLPLLLSLAVLLTSCMQATAPERNVYNSGGNEDEDGLGGTGRTVAPRIIADTYIAGQITKFGSIWVNGVRIKFNRKTYFTVNGKRVKRYAMSIGEVVEVKAEQKQTTYKANAINLRHEVIGRITRINRRKQTATILGQTVSFRKTNIILPRVGQWLQVSGFRHPNGTIHASHIRLSTAGVSLVRGKVSKSRRGLRISRLRLSGVSGASVTQGQWIVVRGAYAKGRLRVSSVVKPENPGHDKRIKRFLVQGIPYKRNKDSVTIDNITIKSNNGKHKGKTDGTTLFDTAPDATPGRGNGRGQNNGNGVDSKPDNQNNRGGNWRGNQNNPAGVNVRGNGNINGRVVRLAPVIGLDNAPDNAASANPNAANPRARAANNPNKPASAARPVVARPKASSKPEKTSPERPETNGNKPERENDTGQKPEKEAPEKEAPEKEVPEKDAPEYERGEREASEKEAPEKEAPERERGERDAPEKEVPEKEAPERERGEREAPEKEAPEKEAPERERGYERDHGERGRSGRERDRDD